MIKNYSLALGDISEALRRYHLILTLAWQDIATRYRRSRIGAFWLTINVAVMIGALGAVFSTLFGISLVDFLPYLTIGLLIWNFMAANLNEACTAFSGGGGIILQTKLPLFTQIGQVLLKNSIILMHNLAIVPVVFLIGRVPLQPIAFLVVPGFLLLIANLLWVMMILAVACARFRDLTQIVGNFVQVLFYVTPVFWKAESLRARIDPQLLYLNPLTSLLDLVRGPLLGQIPEWPVWLFCTLTALAGWAAALWIYGKFLKRVPYWV